MNLAIPLRINLRRGVIEREKGVKESINRFIDLILNSPRHSSISDFEFGFVFMNLRFEVFNEVDGVVHKGNRSDNFSSENMLYEKKISGTSKNMNTFASELKTTIEKYERRLSNVAVTMSYMSKERIIFIVISGYINELKEEYKYSTSLNIWNK